jgi:peptidoglycan/LPS O-acetylase OafA/YrhL
MGAQERNGSDESTAVIGLDLLRGLASLAVALAHLRGLTYVEWGALDGASKTLPVMTFFALTRFGHEAVLTFFVLSGFLIGGQIIRMCQAGTFNPAIYIIDRSTRILLPLIPAVLLTAAISFFVLGEILSPAQVFGNMIGFNGLLVESLLRNGPLWSLSYEIWFYVLGGVIASLFVQGGGKISFILLVMCAAVFAVHNSLLLLIWWLGAVVVLTIDIPRKGIVALIGLGLFLTGSACWQLGWESKSFANIALIPKGVAEVLIAQGVGLTLPWFCAARSNIWLRSFARLAGSLSAISYTLYLVHYPVLSAFEQAFPRATHVGLNSFVALGLRAVAVLIATLVMWTLFERQTNAVRRFLKSRLLSAAHGRRLDG